MKMDYEEALELIEYAISEKREERLWSRWIALYQSKMSFDEFKQNLGEKAEVSQEENLTVEQILDKVEKILG